MHRLAAWAGARTHPGAAGNVATEDLVYMLDGMGIKTGIDLERLCRGQPRSPGESWAAAFRAKFIKAASAALRA